VAPLYSHATAFPPQFFRKNPRRGSADLQVKRRPKSAPGKDGDDSPWLAQRPFSKHALVRPNWMWGTPCQRRPFAGRPTASKGA
jgi:hypothetical protein